MNDEAPFLLTIAQVSLGLVGFSAVVVSLHQEVASWSDFQRLQVRGTIEVGFATVLLSFLPLLIHLFGIEKDVSWRASNGLIGAFLLGYVAVYSLRRRRVKTGENPGSPMFAVLRLAITVSVAILALVSAFCVDANAALNPRAIYAVSLVWMLAVVMIGFMIVLTMVGLGSPVTCGDQTCATRWLGRWRSTSGRRDPGGPIQPSSPVPSDQQSQR